MSEFLDQIEEFPPPNELEESVFHRGESGLLPFATFFRNECGEGGPILSIWVQIINAYIFGFLRWPRKKDMYPLSF